jgi:hypothetical protein
MVEIRSRAHRILKPLSNYRDLSEDTESTVALPLGLTLSAFEQTLGIYTNEAANFSDAIVFTTKGLYLRRDNSWAQVLYSDIERTVSTNSKTEITGLTILLRDGGEFWLPVRHTKAGRFYDAFEVLRFLDRVRNDMTLGYSH